MTHEEIIELLGLEPLPDEGGLFRETYRSTSQVSVNGTTRSASTAIYYLLTSETRSLLHRLRFSEVFHFYLGDPVEMLHLHEDGSSERVLLGPDLASQRPQVVVPSGSWQGARMLSSGKFALMGTTMGPGFEFEDFELGQRADLLSRYPNEATLITALTESPGTPSARP